jgi:hypothetical protein
MAQAACVMTPGIENIVIDLATEMTEWLQGDESWQAVLRGGVIMEVNRTRKLVPTQRAQPQGPQ